MNILCSSMIDASNRRTSRYVSFTSSKTATQQSEKKKRTKPNNKRHKNSIQCQQRCLVYLSVCLFASSVHFPFVAFRALNSFFIRKWTSIGVVLEPLHVVGFHSSVGRHKSIDRRSYRVVDIDQQRFPSWYTPVIHAKKHGDGDMTLSNIDFLLPPKQTSPIAQTRSQGNGRSEVTPYTASLSAPVLAISTHGQTFCSLCDDRNTPLSADMPFLTVTTPIMTRGTPFLTVGTCHFIHTRHSHSSEWKCLGGNERRLSKIDRKQATRTE